MATIALYADRINQMPDLIRDAKKAVDGLRSQLDILKRKCEGVDITVCNLDDVISTISASTDTQDEKTAMLETFGENVDQLARDASVIDDAAADRINQEKDDFYDQYSYLKPDCEKSGWEKFCDGCKKVGQWCKEHWKAIATVVLVVAAIAVIVLTAGAALIAAKAMLLFAAKGILIGAAVGGLAGGTASALFGGSFWEGFENGAFGGAISGALSGGLTSWLSAGSALSSAASIGIASVSEIVSSLLGDIGDIAFAGEKLSFGDVVFNAVFSGILGAGASVFGNLLSKYFKVVIPGINKGNGSWAHVWASQSTRSLRHGTVVNLKTILKGLGSKTVDELWNYVLEPLKSGINELREMLAPKNEEKAEGAA